MNRSTHYICTLVQLVFISFFLSSCTQSGNSSSTLLNTQSSSLTIDSTSTIPVLDGMPTTTGVYIHNNTNHDITDIHYGVVNPKSSSLVINPNSCMLVKANSTCLLKFTTPRLEALNSGSDLITANYNNEQSSQLINYQYVDSSKYNGVTFGGSSIDLVGMRDYATVYAFVGKNATARSVGFDVSNNSVGIVNGLTGSKIDIGSNEVIALELMTNQNITANHVTITPIASSSQTSAQNLNNNILNVAIIPTNNANLIMSNVAVLNSSNQTATVMVYNNGKSAATSLNLTSSNPSIVLVSGANGSCLTTPSLSPNNSCSYEISLVNLTSNGSVLLSLTSSANTKTNTVYYTGSQSAPMIGIVPSSNNLTESVNTTKTLVFDVTDYGNVALTSIDFTLTSRLFVNTNVSITNNTCGSTITAPCQLTVDVAAGALVDEGMFYILMTGEASSQDYSFVSTPVDVAVVDETLPRVVSIIPENESVGTQITTGVVLNFNKVMNPLTLNTSNIKLLRESDNVEVGLTSQGVTNNNQTVSFTQSIGMLARDTNYKVVINPSAILDLNGNAINNTVESIASIFKTTNVDTIAPTIINYAPTSGATKLSKTPAMTVEFSEPMDVNTLNTTSIKLLDSDNNLFNDYMIRYDADSYTAVLELTNGAVLSSESTYKISLDEDTIKDTSGNKLGSNTSYMLTSFTVSDYIAPTIVSASPVNGANNVSLSTSISVTFSEAMNTSTLTNSNIRLYRESTASYVTLASPIYSNGNKTVTLTPNSELAYGESYNIVINPSQIKDTSGNSMGILSTDTISKFITAKASPGIVLSSSTGLLFYSPNNNTLTLESSALTTSSVTASYGNGLFIAGGQPQSLYYSEDGLYWNLASFTEPILSDSVGGSTVVFYGSTYGNNMFVAVGKYIVYSFDGISWNYASPTTMADFQDVIYQGGRFIAVGGAGGVNESGVIATSTDGINWTKEVTSNSYAFRKIVYDNVNNRYIAILNIANNYYIASSESLAGLTSSIQVTTSSRYLISLATYNGYTVVGGYSSGIDIGNGAYYQSTNGINFTVIAGSLAGLQPTNIIYDTTNNYFVAGGCATNVNGCRSLGGYTISNQYGSTWATPSVLDTVNSFRGMTYGAGRIVGLGSGKGDSPFKSGYSAISNDGASTWQVSTQGELAPFNSIMYNGKYIAIGGVGSGESSGRINVSFDGYDWEEIFTTNAVLKSMVYYNKYVVVGNSGKILSSVNENNWIIESSTVSSALNGVTYGKGLFVAVGASGTILTSNGNGSWNKETSGVSTLFNGVSYGNNLFVAVGASGTILTSSDAISWTARSSGESGIFSFVTYVDGKFFAGGANGVLRSSTNGTSWQKVTTNTTLQLYNLVKYNDVYYISGANGLFLKSTDKGVNWQYVVNNKFYKANYVGLGG